MILPRVILRWIQELDLTFAIRNPARDLSNGFAVAEILSRYFPDEVSLHSFEPGISLKARQDNWNQIQKVLLRNSLGSVSNELVSRVMHHSGDSAIEFMVLLYADLTKSPRLPISQSSIRESIPEYARSTAALKVKDPSIDRTVDTVERRLKAIEVIMKHEVSAKGGADPDS
jgi:hypothetical protein